MAHIVIGPSGLGDGDEPVDIQTFIPERPVEGFDIGVARGLVRTRKVHPNTIVKLMGTRHYNNRNTLVGKNSRQSRIWT